MSRPKNTVEKSVAPTRDAAAARTLGPDAASSVRLAAVAGVDSDGRLLVVLENSPGHAPVPALCATDAELAPGDTVALSFIDGDASRPVIVGKLRTPRFRQADGEAQDLILEAQRQITLRCGKSSLILTRAGKLLLRGAYVSTHSSGVNRIKGASVQIN